MYLLHSNGHKRKHAVLAQTMALGGGWLAPEGPKANCREKNLNVTLTAADGSTEGNLEAQKALPSLEKTPKVPLKDTQHHLTVLGDARHLVHITSITNHIVRRIRLGGPRCRQNRIVVSDGERYPISLPTFGVSDSDIAGNSADELTPHSALAPWGCVILGISARASSNAPSFAILLRRTASAGGTRNTLDSRPRSRLHHHAVRAAQEFRVTAATTIPEIAPWGARACTIHVAPVRASSKKDQIT